MTHRKRLINWFDCLPPLGLFLAVALSWLAWVCPLASAETVTHDGTTIDFDVSGLGPVWLDGFDDFSHTFVYKISGLGPGMSSSATDFSISATVEATDGQIGIWDDEQQKYVWVDGVSEMSLYGHRYCDWYLDKHAGQVQVGGGMSGTSSGYVSGLSGTNCSNTVGRLDVVWYTPAGGNGFSISFELDTGTDYSPFYPDKWGPKPDNPDTQFDTPPPPTCTPNGQGLPSYSVNTSSLNLVIEDTDLVYQSYGHSVSLRRVWNSFSGGSGMFGRSWSFEYDPMIFVHKDNSNDPHSCGASHASLNLESGQGFSYNRSSAEIISSDYVQHYTSAVKGKHPSLTSHCNQSTGSTSYVTTYDKDTKRTFRYDFSRTGASDYDLYFRLSSITDRNGNALTLTYGMDGRLQSLTDASGRATTFTLDSNGRCTQFHTFDNRTASFTYDASGNLTSSTDLAGNLSTYTYGVGNTLTAMTVAGRTTTFTYDTSMGIKAVSTVTDPLGKVWQYAFVTAGRQVTGTRVTQPNGAVATYANERGLTTKITDPLGQVTTRAYSLQDLLYSTTDARGKTTTLSWDSNRNLTKLHYPDGWETKYTYDANWNLTSRVGPGLDTWSYTYDGANNPVGITTPLGRTITSAYDNRGLMTRMTMPDGGFYGMTYDTHGNVTGVTDPVGGHSTLAYDASGLNQVSQADPLGNTTGYQFDANRRLTQVTLPGTGSVTLGYDCCALSSVTSALGGTTSFTRDALLRVTKTTDPLGKSTSFVYDDVGNMTAATNPLGQTSTMGFDLAGRQTSSVNPLGNALTFVRDAMGNVTSMTNERGKVTTLEYDDQGLLSSEKDALGRTTATVERHPNGQVLTMTNARGQRVDVYRDADVRITSKLYNYETVANYVWNTAGYLSSYTDATGTTTFTRDAADRVTGMTSPGNLTLTLAYDAAGNVSSMTYPGGLVVTYAHNARNQPSSVTFGGKTVNLTYDASGNLTGETRSNGVQSVYGYDATGRLTSLSHKKGATVLADLAYSRDNAGKVTGESGTWPLPPAPFGDNATAAYNNADGVTTWQTDAYTYDQDGNLTGITGSRTLGVVYDPENRPTSSTLAGMSTTYTYDGQGNRVKSQTGATVRRFLHDPWGRLLCETNAAGQVTANYIYADMRFLSSGTAAAGFVYAHQDKTGNILALTDAAGAKVAAFAYAPYGAVVNRSGTATTPFTYVGAYGVMDEGGDLFFMKNRYYDARTGRFLTRDPIGQAGGFNLYRYVDDNPVTGIDPQGLAGFDPPPVPSIQAEGTYDINRNQLPSNLASSETSALERRIMINSAILGAGTTGAGVALLSAPEITVMTVGTAVFAAYGAANAADKLLNGKDSALWAGKDLTANLLPGGPLLNILKKLSTASNVGVFLNTNKEEIEREMRRIKAELKTLPTPSCQPPGGGHYNRYY